MFFNIKKKVYLINQSMKWTRFFNTSLPHSRRHCPHFGVCWARWPFSRR